MPKTQSNIAAVAVANIRTKFSDIPLDQRQHSTVDDLAYSSQVNGELSRIVGNTNSSILIDRYGLMVLAGWVTDADPCTVAIILSRGDLTEVTDEF